jgi:hypothetical protein
MIFSHYSFTKNNIHQRLMFIESAPGRQEDGDHLVVLAVAGGHDRVVVQHEVVQVVLLDASESSETEETLINDKIH